MFNHEKFRSSLGIIQQADSKLLVISGPTAVGKDTVIRSLASEAEARNLPCRVIRNCSTKKPRLEEADCPNYDLLDPQAFREKIAQNFFIEYINYIQGTNNEVFVGTCAEQMIPQCSHEHLVWKVSPQRLLEIIQFLSTDCSFFQQVIVPVFLGVPHLTLLYCRAKRRAVTPEEWATRLKPNFKKRIADEFEFWREHQRFLQPHLVMNNGNLNHTCEEIITKAVQ